MTPNKPSVASPTSFRGFCCLIWRTQMTLFGRNAAMLPVFRTQTTLFGFKPGFFPAREANRGLYVRQTYETCLFGRNNGSPVRQIGVQPVEASWGRPVQVHQRGHHSSSIPACTNPAPKP